jgi:carbon monoxide dehydrogenase subunit G
MEIIGKQLIGVPAELVWRALNNPEVLKACLPGCESVEMVDENNFKVAIKTVIGPLRARFQGSLRMSEVNAPHSCLMHFEGQGGAVGFGKGSANVSLSQTAEGTELSYEARAQVGGKLAQVGSRLIDSVAKKMTDDFFKAFKLQLVPVQNAEDSAAASKPPSVAGQKNATQPISSKTDDSVSAQMSPATQTRGLSPQDSGVTMVPGWWLAPAALLGALIAILGARLIN